MRELIEKDQRVTLIPADFKHANKGIITEVKPDGFTLVLDYPATGILQNTYCEFYTNSKHGTLYFESYPKSISDDNITLEVSSPARHKFLQRRKFTRIKFVKDVMISLESSSYNITILDISAGGMKFKTSENINIEGLYAIKLPLTSSLSVDCYYQPVRIEKGDDNVYTHSGRFVFKENVDRMTLIQYCTKRSLEIENK